MDRKKPFESATKTHQARYLYPSQIISSVEPAIIKTVLGSCVSVCLWDAELKIGGMNHFMIPTWRGDDQPSGKYGDIAIDLLIKEMKELGSRMPNLRAKLFGGAEGLDQTKYQFKVGQKNIVLAIDMMEKHKIPVIAHSLGGAEGRNIQFFTESGRVLMKFIQKANFKSGMNS